MLLNDFFYLHSLKQQDQILADLSLNVNHPIFRGHFPHQPIVPGVCMIQIIRELLEQSFNRPLQLKKAANIKFVAFIDPGQNPEIQATISTQPQEGGLKVKASLHGKDQVFFKFSGHFS